MHSSTGERTRRTARPTTRKSTENGLQAIHTQNDKVAGLLLTHALMAPDVRMDRVLHLRRAIASGQYRIAAADIADRMLDMLLD